MNIFDVLKKGLVRALLKRSDKFSKYTTKGKKKEDDKINKSELYDRVTHQILVSPSALSKE